jgi:hypothetical protein
MPALLLRVARRRVAWETAHDLDNLIQTEFRTRDGTTDLSISVYEIDEGEIAQTFAEHSAGAGLDPPRGGLGFNVASERSGTPSPGETGFAFTISRHRELKFENANDLRQFLKDVVVPDLTNRKREVAKTDLRAFIRDRRAANDVEWLPFLKTHPKWVKFIAESGT